MDDLDPQPGIDMAIGMMSRAWAELEEGLVLAIASILRIELSRENLAVLRLLDFGRRLEALKCAADHPRYDDQWREEVHKWAHYADNTLRPVRNMLIHGRWGDSLGGLQVELKDMRSHFRKPGQGARVKRLADHGLAPASMQKVFEITNSFHAELGYLADLFHALDAEGRRLGPLPERPQRHPADHLTRTLHIADNDGATP